MPFFIPFQRPPLTGVVILMRGERPHLNFCFTLISKCPSAPRFQPNPHVKWPTLAVHYNDCTADIGHPPAQLIALKTLRDV
eukprot:scaffold382616_cov96-Cyclotella_meneghiniana.AAC.2